LLQVLYKLFSVFEVFAVGSAFIHPAKVFEKYPETNTEIIWKTAKKRLPTLKPIIDELLAEF